MSLKSFLAKHANELQTVATTLGAIVSALPIDRQTKADIQASVTSLSQSALNIANSAEKMVDETGSLDRETLKSMVKELLPDIIGGVVKTETRVAPKRKRAPKKATPAK